MLYGRRYLIELGSAVTLYVVFLSGANYLERALHPTLPARMVLALTTLLGALAAASAIMRATRRMDDLQRRIQARPRAA